MVDAVWHDTTAKRSSLPDVDWLLLGVVLALSAFGLLMVYSSSAYYADLHHDNQFHYVTRQALFLAVGLFGMIWLSRIEYRRFSAWVYPLLFGIGAVLVLVLIPGIGVKMMGARRWLPMGLGYLQPSELAKLVLILYWAQSLARRHDSMNDFKTGFLYHLILPGLLMGLILIEPDFGTTMLLFATGFAMLYVAGTPKRYLFSSVLLMVPLVGLAIYQFPYRFKRWESWWEAVKYIGSSRGVQEATYQVRESMLSIGSGQLDGLGIGRGTMKMFFLPQSHNDYILSTVGQELGFIGLCAVLAAYAIIILRGYRASAKAPDLFGRYLAFGISTLLAVQVLINAGTVMGLLPPKGITLPLVSYGGSSLLATLWGLGLVLSVSRSVTADEASPPARRRA